MIELNANELLAAGWQLLPQAFPDNLPDIADVRRELLAVFRGQPWTPDVRRRFEDAALRALRTRGLYARSVCALLEDNMVQIFCRLDVAEVKA